ncbi:hypothetical protein PITC_016880 [Penicillium italicum]|uniref:Uncharacterized protein n=1 Tax=Penicillium italicum TaxID=40296 RepID=A0A0A2L1J1_PENIT|nr:hypothetical protein PITC_016880 [Penicillium italicum]
MVPTISTSNQSISGHLDLIQQTAETESSPSTPSGQSTSSSSSVRCLKTWTTGFTVPLTLSLGTHSWSVWDIKSGRTQAVQA